jgi:ClpP class serine protease
MGTMALKAGLIDAIGDQEAARGWLAKQLDIAPEEVVFCK